MRILQGSQESTIGTQQWLSGSVGPRTASCSPPPEGAALPISTPQVGAEAQAGPGEATVTSQTSGGARPEPLVFETLSKLLR